MYFRSLISILRFFILFVSLLLPISAAASLSVWGFEDPVAEKNTQNAENPPLASTPSEMQQESNEIGPSWTDLSKETNQDETLLEDLEEHIENEPHSITTLPQFNTPGLTNVDPKEEIPADPTPTEIEEATLSDEAPEISDEALSDLIKEGEETPAQNASSEPAALEITYDMPVAPDNEHVKKYISLFQNRLRPNFEKWLSRSGRYTDMIRTTLRENNLPEDLVYLALIESGFSPHALSKSKASGVWQFMKGTGKRYGLRVDRWIDERRDPVKATHAAAKYLTELYNMFESWPLALAGYNAGESRVYRTIVRVRTRDFWTLRESRHLRPETRNYVPKFMAAMILAKNPEQYGFSVEYDAPWAYDEVEIQDSTYLSSIAKHAGISVRELKSYNPELKQNITPPRAPGYKIKLPPGKKGTFLANYSPEKEEKIFIGRSFKHRVRRGENISSIAAKYGVSTKSILETNNLHSRSIIRIGQKILIHESPSLAGNKHRIRRGESISTIAAKYRVSIRKLLEANNLHRRSVIRAGDTLIIPGSFKIKPTANAKNRTPKRHKIRSGESISTIAQKYAVRMNDLLKANRLTQKSVIQVGHSLIIP